MVECKFICNTFSRCKVTVLIDTWWNVNQGTLSNVENNSYVLIDTWWNVNQFHKQVIEFFNNVLIDTWWNVNFHVHFV